MFTISQPLVSGSMVTVVGVADQRFQYIQPWFALSLCRGIEFEAHQIRLPTHEWVKRKTVSPALTTNRLTVKVIYQLSTGINPPQELIAACLEDAETVFNEVKFTLDKNDCQGNGPIQKPKRQKKGGRGRQKGQHHGRRR